ncbi:hypothetical protein [Streptomyces sp. NPDC059651]|uniref:hypothetical protein n=1 Tax=Streptomyces sp. NPDC059651 TaxID=3346897 RepID=UPI0036775B9F
MTQPLRLVVANVVQWRRYGDLGQELRPGTEAFRGGAKVHVVDTHPGRGHAQLTAVGRGRHTGRWIAIDTGTRHLHTFRVLLVYIPAVLERCGPRPRTREEAVEPAALLERVARHGRARPSRRPASRCVPLPRVPAAQPRVSRGFGASVRPVGGVRLPARYGSGQGAPGPA